MQAESLMGADSGPDCNPAYSCIGPMGSGLTGKCQWKKAASIASSLQMIGQIEVGLVRCPGGPDASGEGLNGAMTSLGAALRR